MKLKTLKPALPCLLALVTFDPSAAFAGTPVAASAKQPATIPDPAPASPLWEVDVRPYGWLASLDGTVGIRGYTAQVDVPFKEILENLEMVAALQLDVRRDRWMVLFDGMYMKLGGSGETPGRLLSNIDVEIEEIMAEAALGYRVWEGKRGFLDVFAGIRYMHIGGDLNLTLDSEGVRSLSEDLSREVGNRVGSAVRDAVNEVAPELKAGAKNKLVGAAGSRIQQRIDEILHNHPNIGSAIDIIHGSDGPVSNAIRDLVKARIAEKQESLADATAAVSSEVAAAKARGRQKARSAVARAERKLARTIEAAITDAIPENVSDSESWVDPFVGFRGRFNITDRLYAVGRADIGGFGVGSDLAWQVYGALGWEFTKRFSFELGYRALSVDYTSGGFTYDTTTAGVFTALGIRF